MDDRLFDSMLENVVGDIPPDAVVSAVTPFRTAMMRILWGLALTTLTLNFFNLNYILPAIGLLLLLLGFRALRRDNAYFDVCFLITVIRSVYFYASLVIHATIYGKSDLMLRIDGFMTYANIALTFVTLLCLKRAVAAVQTGAGMERDLSPATGLIRWYVAMGILAFINYQGIIIITALLIAYVCILRNLHRLSDKIADAGYAITPAAAQLGDRALTILLIVSIALATVCGYAFFGRYDMNWTVRNTSEQTDVSEIKEHLLAIGFPEDVLSDLSESEIAECVGAVEVVSQSRDYPMNKGREVREEKVINGTTHIYISTVFDENELRCTSVAVKLEGERETWKIFHHFRWTTEPKYKGTESIELYPTSQNGGWVQKGNITGRVLCEKDGAEHTADFAFLGVKNYNTDTIFFGVQNKNHPFAAFSMMGNGDACRAYVSYTVSELQDGCIIDSWFTYTRSISPLQYPYTTAMDEQMKGIISGEGVFVTAQGALQFFPSETGTQLYE